MLPVTLLAMPLSLAAGATPLPTQPAGVSHDQKMAWFREAKYGLFIHWGLYASPAGEWKGKAVRPSSEWIMAHVPIPVKEYEELAKQFNPTQFDAEHWVKMAQDAGMKYLVITSKHHDGFAMYHSLVSKYNVYDATPWHRDPLAELAAACARHGIKFGFYYSQSQDWHEPNGAGNTWDFGPDDKKDYDQYLRGKAEPQEMELKLAKLAQSAGVDGVVASVQEAKAIRKACGRQFLIVTPGVRPTDLSPGNKDDQSRTATQREAIKAGADFIVVGRPILAAADPRAAAKEIVDEIAAAKG